MARKESFDKKRAKQVLFRMITNIEYYDISSFKEHLGNLMTEVDLRDTEDVTNFSFLKRRKDD